LAGTAFLQKKHQNRKQSSKVNQAKFKQISRNVTMDKTRKQRYNADWAAISCNIRVHRAGNRCEVCKIPNDLIIRRAKDGSYRVINDEEIKQWTYLTKIVKLKSMVAIKKLGLKKVVLSVAHIDHNEKNDSSANLLCACQWCHLKHDRKDNWMRRKRHTTITSNQFPLML
jgi:hypothetical protein